MPEYAYEALTSKGAVTRGEMPAADEAELEARLRDQGAYLIRAHLSGGRGNGGRRRSPKYTDGRIDRRELLGLTEYLAASVEAGLPILATLDDVAARLNSRKSQRIVEEVGSSMAAEGKSLSEALADHPKAFSQLYVTTVAAGEASGHLDYALTQLVEYLDWQQEISTQIKQATIYPAIVLVAMLVLVSILVGWVFPKLFPILASFDVVLPLPTRIIMATANFLTAYWWMLLLVVAGFIVAVMLARRTERGRWVVDAVVLRLPIFGSLVHQITMARFVTYTALFYRTGVELLRGLTLVERMMENRVVAKAIRDAREAVAGGDSLASAFGRTDLFPVVVVRSIALGEATGGLDEALGRAKAYYDREVPAAVRRMLTALQPALVVLLGVIITVIALSIFLPIISVYQSIGR